jgi:hypothetical protein
VRQSFYSKLCDNFQLSACSVSFASQSGCIAKTDVRSKPFNSRPPKAPLYSVGPPICFGQALRSSVGTHTSDPMMKSDGKCQKEGLMTRKLLLTAAIVALALAPRSALGLPRPAVLAAVESGAAFTADSGAASMAAGSDAAFTVEPGAAFTADSGAAFTADTVVSIRAITDMAISRTAITVTDRLRLTP